MKKRRRRNPSIDTTDFLIIGVVALGGYMVYRATRPSLQIVSSPPPGASVTNAGSPASFFDAITSWLIPKPKGSISTMSKFAARATAGNKSLKYFSVKDSLGVARCFETSSGKEEDTSKCMLGTGSGNDPNFLAGSLGSDGLGSLGSR